MYPGYDAFPQTHPISYSHKPFIRPAIRSLFDFILPIFIYSFMSYPTLSVSYRSHYYTSSHLGPIPHLLHFARLHFMIQKLLRLISRFPRMTSIQPILPIHNHIVTDIIDIRSISPIWFDIDILKSPIETRVGFTTVNFDNSFSVGSSGKVFEVDIGPFECSCIWV